MLLGGSRSHAGLSSYCDQVFGMDRPVPSRPPVKISSWSPAHASTPADSYSTCLSTHPRGCATPFKTHNLPASAANTGGSVQVAVSKARRAAPLPLRRLVPPARFRYSAKTSGAFGGGKGISEQLLKLDTGLRRIPVGPVPLHRFAQCHAGRCLWKSKLAYCPAWIKEFVSTR